MIDFRLLFIVLKTGQNQNCCFQFLVFDRILVFFFFWTELVADEKEDKKHYGKVSFQLNKQSPKCAKVETNPRINEGNCKEMGES